MLTNHKGYTLLELIIVMAITIVFLKIMIPSVNVEKRNLHNAAKELASDIRYAQRTAINENKNCIVNFYKTNDSYNVSLAGSESLAPRKYFKNDIYVYYNSSVNQSINYTALGTTGSACEITLASKQYKIKLTVTVGSGRVKIFDIEKK